MFSKVIKTIITLSSFALVVVITAPTAAVVTQVTPQETAAPMDVRSPDEAKVLDWIKQRQKLSFQNENSHLYEATNMLSNDASTQANYSSLKWQLSTNSSLKNL